MRVTSCFEGHAKAHTESEVEDVKSTVIGREDCGGDQEWAVSIGWPDSMMMAGRLCWTLDGVRVTLRLARQQHGEKGASRAEYCEMLRDAWAVARLPPEYLPLSVPSQAEGTEGNENTELLPHKLRHTRRPENRPGLNILYIIASCSTNSCIPKSSSVCLIHP